MRTFYIPVELCEYVLKNKFCKAFRLYLLLKARCDGKMLLPIDQIEQITYYEKGKRQNRLRDGEDGEPNDIKKIVETYQFRKEADRYSRRVSMAEIEKNDYNLNISRYVSTAVDDEEIGLQKVNENLVDIENKATAAREKHNTFLRELGLRPI